MIELNFYAIITAIENLRIARNMKQKELIAGIIDPSSYSKMKNNQLNINLQDAYALLNRLNANWIDLEDTYFFISKREKYIQDTYQRIIAEKEPDIKQIESFYLQVQKLYQTNGEILRIYLLLKSYYSGISEIITEIQTNEINEIYERIEKSDILTSIDYKLIGDLTSFFSINQLKALAPRIIVDDIVLFSERASVFQSYVPNCLSNIADIFIDNSEFELAKPLLKNLEQIAIKNNNFFIMALTDFLNYRLHFFSESDKEKKTAILTQYEKWMIAAEQIHGKLPAFQQLKYSFENLKKNTFQRQIIIRNI